MVSASVGASTRAWVVEAIHPPTPVSIKKVATTYQLILRIRVLLSLFGSPRLRWCHHDSRPYWANVVWGRFCIVCIAVRRRPLRAAWLAPVMHVLDRVDAGRGYCVQGPV